MLIFRWWNQPSAHTVSMSGIKKLLSHYMPDKARSNDCDCSDSLHIKSENGCLVLDPFAGNSVITCGTSTCSLSNDINPDMPTTYHMDAIEFLNLMHHQNKQVDACILDPPYTLRQIKEQYKRIGPGSKEQIIDLYEQCKDRIATLIKPGGLVFTMGYSSMGMGEHRGFTLETIQVLSLGGPHRDIIVVVDRRQGNFESNVARSPPNLQYILTEKQIHQQPVGGIHRCIPNTDSQSFIAALHQRYYSPSTMTNNTIINILYDDDGNPRLNPIQWLNTLPPDSIYRATYDCFPSPTEFATFIGEGDSERRRAWTDPYVHFSSFLSGVAVALRRVVNANGIVIMSWCSTGGMFSKYGWKVKEVYLLPYENGSPEMYITINTPKT